MDKKIKVAADTAIGVYKVEVFEGNAPLAQEDFYSSLSSLKDGQIIYAEIDHEMAEKIQDEYGIH
jgi:hypothetical protein